MTKTCCYHTIMALELHYKLVCCHRIYFSYDSYITLAWKIHDLDIIVTAICLSYYGVISQNVYWLCTWHLYKLFTNILILLLKLYIYNCVQAPSVCCHAWHARVCDGSWILGSESKPSPLPPILSRDNTINSQNSTFTSLRVLVLPLATLSSVRKLY